MPSDVSTAFFVLWLIVAVTFSYAAYWAFTIRRVLVHRLYRRQATWVGRMGVYFVALSSFLTLALSTGVSSRTPDRVGIHRDFRLDGFDHSRGSSIRSSVQRHTPLEQVKVLPRFWHGRRCNCIGDLSDYVRLLASRSIWRSVVPRCIRVVAQR